MNRRKIRSILGVFLAAALLLSCIPLAFGAFAAGTYHVMASATGLTDGALPDFQNVEVALKQGESLYIVLDPVDADGNTISGGFWRAGVRPNEIVVKQGETELAYFGNSVSDHNRPEFTYAYSYTPVNEWSAADAEAHLIDNLIAMVDYDAETHAFDSGNQADAAFKATSSTALYGETGMYSTGGWGAFSSDVTETNIARAVLQYTATEDGTYVVNFASLNGYESGTLYLLSEGCEHKGTKTPVENTKNATCTTYGYTGDYTCDNCGATLSGEPTAKLAHNYVAGICEVCGGLETNPKYGNPLATATGLTDGALPDFQDVEVTLKAGESLYIVVDPVNAAGQPVGGGWRGILPADDITVTLDDETKAQFGKGADSYNEYVMKFDYRYSYTARSTWDAAEDKTALLLDNLTEMGAFTAGQWDDAGWYTGAVFKAAPEEYGMVGLVATGEWGAILSNASNDYVARAVLKYTATEDGTYVVNSGAFNSFGDVTLYLLAGHACAENAKLDEETAVEKSCTVEGFEADTVCTLCGEVVVEGASTGKAEHVFTDGETCDNCTEPNPNYVAPTPSTPEGYAAAIDGPDADVKVGDPVVITVDVTKTGDTQFASAELTITYDPNKLTYAGIEEDDLGAQGQVKSATLGTLVISDSGASKDLGTGVYTINFTAKAEGAATVTLTDAKFSTQTLAETQNLATATVTTGVASVTIIPADYDVTLLGGFNGLDKAPHGGNYTFTYLNSAYYTFDFDVTMGGNPVDDDDVITNDDGSFTIENVTGALVINATVTPRTYNVTADGTGADDAELAPGATYGTPYNFNLPTDVPAGLNVGYTYKLGGITINGVEFTGYTDGENGGYVIPGGDIKGDIVITITKTEVAADQFTVSVGGEGQGQISLDKTVVNKDGSVTLTLNPEKGYLYTITYTMGENEPVTVATDVSTMAPYAIDNVTANVTITANRKVDITSGTVGNYLTMNETEMWLITIGDEIEGKVYQYKRTDMFWSDEYEAYCFLVVSTDEPVLAAGDFTIVTSDVIAVDYTGNVNMSSTIDTNDAQLVYNMYNTNTTYSDFTTNVTMEKFLRADVNGSEKVDVADATMIVNGLLENA